jgi:hypothetical protein
MFFLHLRSDRQAIKAAKIGTLSILKVPPGEEFLPVGKS